MSLVQHTFDARLALPLIRRAAERALARLALAFRRRRASLDPEDMPDWQLRDLGFRDGRDTAARRCGRG